MDRKTYIRDVYSQYWLTAREQVYGFSDYDKQLCEHIGQRVEGGAKLLEVAIGTGFPFADFFQRAGFDVHGVDISPDLVQRCRELNRDITATVGDAEELDYPDEFFDCTYCFHSTWYFSDLPKAIGQMLRVTRRGGLVAFDIQNLNNREINFKYNRNLFQSSPLGRSLRYAKNVAKLIIRRGPVKWTHVVYETSTDPQIVYGALTQGDASVFDVLARDKDGSIGPGGRAGRFENHEKLLFVVQK